MHTCKKGKETTTNQKASIAISINVTDIVKYVCLAGVAIVGIVFGFKYMPAIAKTLKKED